MHNTNIEVVLSFFCCFLVSIGIHASAVDNEGDVISYYVTIEPEIEKGYIKGTVTIIVQIDRDANKITLNSGSLQIDQVIGENVVGFKQHDDQVVIELSERQSGENKITIDYHGNPSSGLLFNPVLDQAYTVFFTSQWMICNNSPSDKAKLSLDILVPDDKYCIANGELIQKTRKEGKTLYSWRQDYESPTYTYGFVIGNFTTSEEKPEGILFKYFSTDNSPDELKVIFKETHSMMSFFEDKSGIKYYQPSYSQILIGDHYQEMSGFSVLKESYGRLVLKDSTETNLISHELAHQWWGNQITCNGWNHFWLNEGFATYMSAAYNEYRFGKEKYNSDINSYFDVYQDIKKRGNDKSLVFRAWTNPSRDDRNLVYFKGAYVLHLLRQEMGALAFWKGIKFYSQTYFGKTVVTDDFQHAMEESSGKNLDSFFDKWIYKKE